MMKIKKFLKYNQEKVQRFLARPFKPNWKRILIFVAIPIVMGTIASTYSGCQCKIPWVINALGYIIVAPYFVLDILISMSGAKPPIFTSEIGYFINDIFLYSIIVWWYVLSGLIISGLNKLNLKKLFGIKRNSGENK